MVTNIWHHYFLGKNRLLVLSLLGTLIFCLLFISACERTLDLQVDNQTDQTVTMRVEGMSYFDVLPHTIDKKPTTIIGGRIYFVEGVIESGEIIYSGYFTDSDVVEQNFKGSTIKIVISPNEENPYLPLEIENRLSNVIVVVVNGAIICDVQPGVVFKSRPLPSNLDSYSFNVTEMKGFRGNKKILDNKTFSRDELEKQNWKITISNPP